MWRKGKKNLERGICKQKKKEVKGKKKVGKLRLIIHFSLFWVSLYGWENWKAVYFLAFSLPHVSVEIEWNAFICLALFAVLFNVQKNLFLQISSVFAGNLSLFSIEMKLYMLKQENFSLLILRRARRGKWKWAILNIAWFVTTKAKIINFCPFEYQICFFFEPLTVSSFLSLAFYAFNKVENLWKFIARKNWKGIVGRFMMFWGFELRNELEIFLNEKVWL